MPNPYLQNNKYPISSQHLRNINNINRREIVQCRKFETMQCNANFGCKNLQILDVKHRFYAGKQCIEKFKQTHRTKTKITNTTQVLK